MPAKKKLTPAQQRDRRSKILLAVVGVVFLGVMALQLPKLMKGSGSAAPPPPAPTTAGSAPGTAAPVASSQLASFSHFAAKDPFKPGVKLAVTGGAPGSTTTPATAPATPPARTPKPKLPPSKPVTFSVQPQGVPPAPAPTGPMVPAAVLTIDGKKRVIPLNTTFPADHPVFRLVAVGTKAIWLELIGGSFSDGNTSLKVEKGHPVKLVNTTAGTTFVLALLKPTTAPKPVVTTTAATTSASTTTAATTTSAG